MAEPDVTADFSAPSGVVGDTTMAAGYAPADALAPTVPGYEILGELGRGGMGVVYRARHVGLGREVALKVILAGGFATEGVRQRFAAEARAVAASRHPGIVQVYELGDVAGLPFMALELCPGGTLADKVGGTPMLPREAAEKVVAIARAVHAAHLAGIVHRDLKPVNVLFAADGSPRVGDFGLAYQVETAGGLTATGAILGTPSYMAPEQANGSDSVTPATDVYGLGAVLYECLTARPPFREATPLATLRQVTSSEPVPPSRLSAAVPRDLETVCLKCLQKKPERRYPTAEALADDLQRYLDGRPVSARRAGAAERLWKAARRRPAVAALVAAVALAAVTVVGVVAWSNAQLRVEKEAARRDRDLAEGRLTVALDAVDRMMLRTAGERWARNPFLQAERKAVLEDAVALFRRFSDADSRDPRVRRQSAQVDLKIGIALMHLGDYEGSSRALDAAKLSLDDLAKADPGDAGLRNDAALAHLQSAYAEGILARLSEATVEYEAAVAEAREAKRLAPDRPEPAMTLAEALTSWGHFSASSRPAETPKIHAEVVAIAAEWRGRPGAEYGADLFAAIGQLNVKGPDVAAGTRAGVAALDEAQTLLAGLQGRESPSARWSDMADFARSQACNFRAMALNRSSPAKALESADAGLAALERLLAVQPKSFPYLLQRITALGVRARILWGLSRWEDGIKSVDELLAVGHKMLASSDSLGWLWLRLVVPQSERLVAVATLGRLDGFDAAARTLLDSMPPRDPDPARNLLADSVRYNVACAHALATKFADADRHISEAVAILNQLVDGGYFALPAHAAQFRKDPDFDLLRTEARFKAVAERIGPSK